MDEMDTLSALLTLCAARGRNGELWWTLFITLDKQHSNEWRNETPESWSGVTLMIIKCPHTCATFSDIITVTSPERNDVSNNRQLHSLFRLMSKKAKTIRNTGTFWEEPPAAGGLPSQRANDVESAVWASYYNYILTFVGLVAVYRCGEIVLFITQIPLWFIVEKVVVCRREIIILPFTEDRAMKVVHLILNV